MSKLVGDNFEEMSRLGTLEDYLSECSYTRVNGILAPQCVLW
ncbi:MAG TPA: hypothetical protein VL334_13240 [Anaerolineae bacterium]|nr:hypothetical protein [Anaerolineae bacterium]